MSPPSVSRVLSRYRNSLPILFNPDPLLQCLAPRLNRSYATETALPALESAAEMIKSPSTSTPPKPNHPALVLDSPQDLNHQQSTTHTLNHAGPSSQILTTLYSWPYLEPTRFAWYNDKHLGLPLRRDLLHRAVIYEADASRQGTASTKWRADVHGSNRKLYAQKGTGRARAGDKKSPSRRGGGVAFGPHPRDFSTDLQRKVYDLAWRTALSYRYKKGELVILDDRITLPRNVGGPRLLANVFEGNQWGKPNGRSLLVTQEVEKHLYESMEEIGEHGLVKDITDVDVKDLLETGRIVIEREALNTLLAAHSSDLGRKMSLELAVNSPKEWVVQYSR